MANPDKKIVKMWSRNGKDSVDVLYKLNPDGVTYSQSVAADMGDVTLDIDSLEEKVGGLTDASVQGDNSGSLSAKLRGLGKLFLDVYDAVNHGLKVNVVAGGGGSGLTDTQLRATSLPVSGPLTDTQIRATALPVSLAVAPTGQVVKTNTFSLFDSLVRPHNTTAYSANKSINCNGLVTAMSYNGLTVTLTVPNSLNVGDYFTVALVNAGFSVTHIDGNWVCKAGTNATTIVFDVALQPTGTTPQTITVGTIAKLLSIEVADNNGDGVILSRLSVAIQGVAMVGAIRVYVYTQPTSVLVDQSVFTLLNVNDTYRKDYYDITLITEAATSDVVFGAIRLWEMIKCDPNYKRLFFRIVAEGALTPVNDGLITLRTSGVKLGG